MANLKVDFLGKVFKNPVVAASGTFGFGEEYNDIYDVGLLGGISSKGLTLKSKQGNEGIRLWETPMGLMNSIGLQNPGVESFISREINIMKQYKTNVIANLGGNTLDDYLIGVKLLNDSEVDIIELNISCPNVKEGGMAFGIKADIAYNTVKAVREICRKPLMVKLSPNAESIPEMAAACEEAGADALSLINTINAMAIDIYARKSVFNNYYAGLSGPAVKPIALRMVHQSAKAVKIPVCGMGGISSGVDAIEFIMAGASIIQVGTANFVKADSCLDIIKELDEFLDSQGIRDIKEITGII
ncbi:MAG: Dihydroorotate dehydrogenase [Clostridiales bacterium 38_11]|nr:MAG: Dihydroorotate dehydrogenase [Clostridiales bacterium 38_11]HBH12400.1 dihydroorotate dehydrogenase [Clostridiales bacterium]